MPVFYNKGTLTFLAIKKLLLPFSFLSSHSSPPLSSLFAWAGNLSPSAHVACCPFVLSSAQLWPEEADKFPPFSRKSNFQI